MLQSGPLPPVILSSFDIVFLFHPILLEDIYYIKFLFHILHLFFKAAVRVKYFSSQVAYPFLAILYTCFIFFHTLWIMFNANLLNFICSRVILKE